MRSILKEEKRLDGVITLFLSLLLMILVSFLCTAFQSARSAGSRYLFTLASEAATRSVFAAYDTRVWEQYRILMLTDEELAEQIGTECGESYTQGGTLFSVSVSSVELTKERTLAENGALGWEEAAVSYMEARLPAELISWLWDQSGLTKGLEDMKKALTGFRDLFQPLIDLEQKLCDLEKKLSGVITAFEQGKQLLADLEECSGILQQLSGEGAEEETLKEAWDRLTDLLGQLKDRADSGKREVLSLADQAEKQLKAAEKLNQQIRELLGSMEEADSTGLALLSRLGEYQSGLLARFDFLKELPEQLKAQQDFMSRITDISLPSFEEVLAGEAGEKLAALQNLAGGLAGEDWDPDRLNMTEGTEEDRENVSRFQKLKEWLDQGILQLVLEDSSTVSQASLSRELSRTDREESDTLLDRAYENLLYGEYALRYTAQYGEDGKAGLQYETEYLIAGEGQDEENLAAVALDLLLLRGTVNLAFLLQDEASRSQVRPVAAGISAVLGGWIPESLLSVLLMVLWALAEAVCDVRALLAEGKVPFWKDSSDWQLSFDSLWSLFGGEYTAGKDRKEGMTYEEYLRILLLLTPLEEKCYRTMEIAEENIRADRGSFRIDLAVDRAVVVVTGQAAGRDCQMSLEYGY